jgi:non-heme chloroperoxidase
VQLILFLPGFVTLGVLGMLVAALALIVSQPSDRPEPGAGGLDFSGLTKAGFPPVELRDVVMRDGSSMPVRDYANAQGPLLVLVHGSGWHGGQFQTLAARLQPLAHVVVPDLRGHGAGPQRRGDVDYIGQLEDDLADLIAAKRRPGQKVVMAGHSSGGGLVVRFAGGRHGALLDSAILLAPFLKYNAPTTRPGSGGWAQPLVRRIIGLSLLNMLHITVLNWLTVIRFNFPQSVLSGPLGDTATMAYSYRMNTSFAPRRRYLHDVAALPPFLLLAAQEDEAFFARRYQPLMAGVTDKGRYRVVAGAGHLGIVDAPETLAAISEMLGGV